MGYSSDMDVMYETCDLMSRELRKANERLNNPSTPFNLEDATFVEAVTRSILNIKKAASIAESMDMNTPYGMTMYGANGGRNMGNRGGYGPMGASIGNFSGEWQSGDQYGRQRRSATTGRYMDDETHAKLRDMMNRTQDPQIREEIRHMLGE